MSSFNITDSYNVNLMKPYLYYERSIQYPKPRNILLTNIKTFLANRSDNHQFENRDKELIELCFSTGDVDIEKILNVYMSYIDEFAQKRNTKTMINKKNQKFFFMRKTFRIKDLKIPFMMSYSYSYWNPLENYDETANILIDELPLYVLLFLKINYAFHMNKLIYEVLLEKDGGAKKKKKPRVKKSKLDDNDIMNYTQEQKELDDSIHFSESDIKFKINNTDKFKFWVCRHRLNKMISSNMELLVHIDKMCYQKKYKELVVNLSGKEVYEYFANKNKITYEYFETDENTIKVSYKKHKRENNADIARRLMKKKISNNDTPSEKKYMFSEKYLLEMDFDDCVRAFKKRLVFYSGNNRTDFDVWMKNGCSGDLSEYKIGLLRTFKHFFPLFQKSTKTEKTVFASLHKNKHVNDMRLLDRGSFSVESLIDKEIDHFSLEECTIFYVCMIRVNLIYELIGKSGSNEELRYNVHLMLFDHLPMIAYIIDSGDFRDSQIKSSNNGSHYPMAKPTEGRGMHSGNLPDIKPLLLDIDFVSQSKGDDKKKPIKNIVDKVMPFCCKIRMITNIVRKHYNEDREARHFIDACIECSLFGLYPTSDHSLFTNFTMILKLFTYIYIPRDPKEEDTSKARKRLFIKISRNQLVLQGIIRECLVYCINRLRVLKEFLVNNLWSGTPFIWWSKFENSVRVNSDLIRKYFNRTGKIPGFWDHKPSSSIVTKKYDKDFIIFLEDEYKLNEYNNSDTSSGKSKRKKKAPKAWISSDIYRIFPNNWVESVRGYLNDLFIEKYVLNTVKKTKETKDVVAMLDLPPVDIMKKIDAYERLGDLSRDYVKNFEDIFTWLSKECSLSVEAVTMLCNTINFYILKKSPNSIKSELRILYKDNIRIKDFVILKYYIIHDQKMNFIKTIPINENEAIKTLISVQIRNKSYINPCTMDTEQYKEVRQNLSKNHNDMDDFKVKSTKCCRRITAFAFGLGYGNFKIISDVEPEDLINPNAKPFEDKNLRCCSYSKKGNSEELKRIVEYDQSKDVEVIKDMSKERTNSAIEKKVRRENEQTARIQRIIDKQNMIVPFNATDYVDIYVANKMKKQRAKRKSADPLKSLSINKATKKLIKKQARKIMRSRKINPCKVDSKNGITSINGFNKLVITNTRNDEMVCYRFCPECGGFSRYYQELVINGQYMCDRCTTLHPRRNVFAYCGYYKKSQLIPKQKMEQIIQSDFSDNLMVNNILNGKRDFMADKKRHMKGKVSLTDRDFSKIVTSDKNKRIFRDTFVKYYQVMDSDGIIKTMPISNRLTRSNLYLRRASVGKYDKEMVFVKYIEQY